MVPLPGNERRRACRIAGASRRGGPSTAGVSICAGSGRCTSSPRPCSCSPDAAGQARREDGKTGDGPTRMPALVASAGLVWHRQRGRGPRSALLLCLLSFFFSPRHAWRGQARGRWATQVAVCSLHLRASEERHARLSAPERAYRWSTEGIGERAREAPRLAARRQGISRHGQPVDGG